MNLTNKETEVLKYLLKVRVATVYQIMRDLSAGRGRAFYVRHLTRLATLKWVHKNSCDFKTVYSLGPKAVRAFKVQGLLSSDYKPAYLGFNPMTARHDLKLTDLYATVRTIPHVFDIQTHNDQLIFEKHKLTEHNISDLMLKIRPDQKTFHVAIELELSRKNPKDYNPIFSLYRNDAKVQSVLYLVTSEALKYELLSIEKKMIDEDDEARIYVGSLNDFYANPERAKFEACDGKYFKFNFIKPTETHSFSNFSRSKS